MLHWLINDERLTASELVAAVCAVCTAVADDGDTDTLTVIAECRQFDRQATAVCIYTTHTTNIPIVYDTGSIA